MKKIFNLLILTFLLCFSLIPPVLAETKYGQIVSSVGNGVKTRKGPSTSYEYEGDGLAEGRIIEIIEKVGSDKEPDTCGSKEWYKIVYGTTFAYVCSSFVVEYTPPVVPDYNFEEELKKFPESYHASLRILKQTYPNAKFVAYDTGLEFSDAVRNESSEQTYGKSLFWDSNGSYDGWKYFPSYNYQTNSFDNRVDSNPNFYIASQELVAYYLDPRNFLNKSQVFMFQSVLMEEGNTYTIEGIEGILKNSFMHNTYVDKGTDLKFSNVMLNSGIYYNINPYYIAGRILQETGYTRSSLVKGTYPEYPDYDGYYNFFNYGAYKTDSGSATYNGLVYAKRYGWNSEQKSIDGGIKQIAGTYVKEGQDTGYFQKWDVVCKVNPASAPCYSYQYMTNIQAPASESTKTYNGYVASLGTDFYVLPLVFKIPIYKNMPASTPLPDSRSPINYLSRLVINGNSIAGFHGLTTEYNLNIPFDTTNLNIEAEAIAQNKGATVSGAGNIKVEGQKQDIVIKVTAANGKTLDYIIHVNRLKPEESTITLDETIKNIKSVTINENYISGLTSYDTIKDAIKTANPNAYVTVYNLNNEVITDGNLATGYKLKIEVNNDTKEFEIVIYGDNNGDGEITIVDLLRVQKHLLKSSALSGANLKASNISRDGDVSILDLLKIQKHLLGVSIINQ